MDQPSPAEHQWQRDGFTRADLLTVAENFGIKDGADLIGRVTTAVADWPRFAKQAGVNSDQQRTIAKTHRLALAEKQAKQ